MTKIKLQEGALHSVETDFTIPHMTQDQFLFIKKFISIAQEFFDLNDFTLELIYLQCVVKLQQEKGAHLSLGETQLPQTRMVISARFADIFTKHVLYLSSNPESEVSEILGEFFQIIAEDF